GESPGDPLAGGGRIEGEKLAFTRRATPRAQAVDHRPGEARLVVPLTMEHDLGAFGRTGAQPPGKFRVTVQWPGPGPVGHHEQRGGHPTLDAELPEAPDVSRQCRRDIVNRDEDA